MQVCWHPNTPERDVLLGRFNWLLQSIEFLVIKIFNWPNVWKSYFTTSTNLIYAMPVRNTVMKLGSARLHIATAVSVYCWEFACNSTAFTVPPLFLHLALSLSPCTASPLPITVYLCFSRVCMKLNPPGFPTLASPHLFPSHPQC